MPEVVKAQTPWDLARESNQTIVSRVLGPMYAVYYPYRKTGDLYVAIDGEPIHCCQCDEDIPVDNGLKPWLDHIKKHSRKKLVKPIIIVARDNEGKPQVLQEK